MNKWIYGCILAVLPGFAVAADPSSKQSDGRFSRVFRDLDVNKTGKLSRMEVALKAPALAENFDQIDKNHDGGLTQKEIKQALALAQKRRRDFSQGLAKADRDNNGKLSRQEASVLPNISKNFDVIDSNHDGALVIKEIADYVRAQIEPARETSVN